MLALALAMVEGPEEQSKFRALAARYERLMFHVARQILPNEQDAEDAVQEAFLAIAKNFSKISAVDSPKTKAFVVIVTESKAIDIARKNARQGQQVPLEDLPGLSVPAQGEDSLTQCILRLPGRYREFFRLKYELGYSTREAGQLMGLSWAAARKLEQRAKEKLRALCQEEGIL